MQGTDTGGGVAGTGRPGRKQGWARQGAGTKRVEEVGERMALFRSLGTTGCRDGLAVGVRERGFQEETFSLDVEG